MSDAVYQEKVKAPFGELYQPYGNQIDEFFAARPEYRISNDS